MTHKSATKPVVIGYGNPIRQDDGMGWRAAELLQKALPADLATIIEDHQLTPELVAELKDASLVVFLDAAVDLNPGTIRFQSLHPAQVQSWSHHILPDQLLKLAEQANGRCPQAFLISGGVQEMGFSEAMTGTAEKCAEEMADLAYRLVKNVVGGEPDRSVCGRDV